MTFYKIIDNFLPEKEFLIIKNLVMREDFLYSISRNVTFPDDPQKHVDYDYWYAVNVLYWENRPKSEFFREVYDIFIPKFKEIASFRSLIRIKVNLYPHTYELKEHPLHQDLQFDHQGALFYINTCDGFTRLEDGTKIDSVENRILFFDSSKMHGSSTTTNDYSRRNINFNFV